MTQDHRRPKPERRTLRDLLREASRRPSRSQVLIGLLVGILGFAMVTQVRETNSTDSYSGLRSNELVQVLNGLTVEGRRAAQEIDDLERQRNELRDSTRRRQAAVDRAREESQTLGLLAGTAPARGPGIRITLEDPKNGLTLTHLLDSIQEMRDAGAEVMEINDSVRVVAQTWFDNDAGGTGIVVDGTRLRQPYAIDVIGDPDVLARAVTFPGGLAADAETDGATVRVQKLEALTIRSVVREPSPEYAEPNAGQ